MCNDVLFILGPQHTETEQKKSSYFTEDILQFFLY